jgi:predicted ATPase with chaperone activity
MLARRLATILPAMTLAEALETMRLPRVAGLTGGRTTLMSRSSARRSFMRGAIQAIFGPLAQ